MISLSSSVLSLLSILLFPSSLLAIPSEVSMSSISSSICEQGLSKQKDYCKSAPIQKWVPSMSTRSTQTLIKSRPAETNVRSVDLHRKLQWIFINLHRKLHILFNFHRRFKEIKFNLDRNLKEIWFNFHRKRRYYWIYIEILGEFNLHLNLR